MCEVIYFDDHKENKHFIMFIICVSRLQQTVIHHHWVHRRHQKGRCRQCGKSFQSKLSFGNKVNVFMFYFDCALHLLL
jgi:hypothetical protein